jgi:hypothetical protein
MEKRIARYEANETKAYRSALSAADTKISVGIYRSVTGNRVAASMQEQGTNIESRNGKGYQGGERSGGQAEAWIRDANDGQFDRRSDVKSIPLRIMNLKDEPQYDRIQREVALHEGLHGITGLWVRDPGHQAAFQQAIDQILRFDPQE